MSNDKKEEISLFTEEQENIRAYIEKVYSERVPPPDRPSLTFWNLVGVKTVFFSASSLGAIIFSAIRTGGYFYLVEVILLSKFNIPEQVINGLAIAAFVSALFAFEGFAVADGFSKGEKMSDVEESNWGLWASFLTITLVGIFSGLGIADITEGFQNTFSIITAVLTSISAASIAFFGGKNLGFAVRDFNEKKKLILESHQIAYDDWREGAFRSYTSTMGSVRKRVQGTSQNEHQNEQGDENVQQDVQSSVSTMNKSDMAYRLLNDYVQANGKMPSVRTLSSLASVSVGTASPVINEYIYDNKEALIEDGIIDDKRYREVVEKFLDKEKEIE